MPRSIALSCFATPFKIAFCTCTPLCSRVVAVEDATKLTTEMCSVVSCVFGFDRKIFDRLFSIDRGIQECARF